MRVAALLALLAPLLGGCGYSAGLRVRPQGVPSLGVEHFGNETLERDVEREFHDELTRALRSYVDVPLQRVDAAPFVVRGIVRQYHRRGGIRSPDNELLETGIYLEVEANVYPRGSTTALRTPMPRASTWVGFVIEPSGRNERQARERAMRHVAEELVLDLFAGVN
jgi:hypothetical protein